MLEKAFYFIAYVVIDNLFYLIVSIILSITRTIGLVIFLIMRVILWLMMWVIQKHFIHMKYR